MDRSSSMIGHNTSITLPIGQLSTVHLSLWLWWVVLFYREASLHVTRLISEFVTWWQGEVRDAREDEVFILETKKRECECERKVARYLLPNVHRIHVRCVECVQTVHSGPGTPGAGHWPWLIYHCALQSKSWTNTNKLPFSLPEKSSKLNIYLPINNFI